ncbi:MAG: YcxB family protein [Candidatus Acidiferrales bacterium]
MSAPSATIRISFQLSPREWYRANVAIATVNLRTLRIFAWVSVALLLACVVVKAAGTGRPAAAATNLLPLFVILPIAVIIGTYLAPYPGSRSVYKNSASLKNTIQYSFSGDSVTQKSAAGRSEVLWTAYPKARETRDWFLLYTQKRLAHPLPKRAFANENEITEFRDLVRRRVKNASLRG